MRYYSGPIITLVLALLIAIGCAYLTNGQYRTAQDQKLAAESTLEATRTSLADWQKTRDAANKWMPSIRQFLAAWSLYSSEGDSPAQVVVELGDMARGAGLVSRPRPTPKNDQYPFAGGLATVQMVAYSVTGDYKRALDWLGRVETRYPYARVESLIVQGAGIDGVELMVNMAFMEEIKPAPITDDSEDADEGGNAR